MLGIVLTSVFVQLLDISIVNVAIPSIQRDLGAGTAAIQLVIAGYQLAFACTLISAARLGDIRGRRTLFVSGMAVFTVASLLCGLAPDPTTLVLARALQGLGSGLMFPQVLSVIQVTFLPEERGRAFGIFGATIGLATICGPLFGGLLLKADVFGTDWRAIFLVNVPMGIAAIVLALREMPDSVAPGAPRLDLPGVGLIAVGLFLLVFPLTEGRQRGLALVDLPHAGGQRPRARRVRRGCSAARRAENDDPLVLLSLFGDPVFRSGAIAVGRVLPRDRAVLLRLLAVPAGGAGLQPAALRAHHAPVRLRLGLRLRPLGEGGSPGREQRAHARRRAGLRRHARPDRHSAC